MRFYSALPVYMVLYAVLFQKAHLHFYTAVSDLEELIVTEENILNSLDLYLKVEEERLEKVKRKREQFARVHELAKVDAEQFLWNPINAYLLVKRLTTDWYETWNLVESPQNKDLFKKAASQIMIYPEEKDLIEAAEALLRLQEFYSLDSSDMARGQIKRTTLSTELTVEDCFVLGRRAYQTKKWQQSLYWFQQSLQTLENRKNTSASHKIEILIHMANAYKSLKNYSAAAEISENILKLEPNHAQAKGNLKFYRSQEENVKNTEIHADEPEQHSALNKQPLPAVNTYKSLCKGKKNKKPEEEKQLHCYFTSNNNYFLLQPSKVEILNLEPFLIMHHDVLKDGEADILKALAYPKLEESPMPIRSSGRPRCNRISKSALFQDLEHSVVAKISKRLQDVIGLNSHPDSPLQVENFGIGGYYDPHVDYETMSKPRMTSAMGYPLATWLVYLSDVISGGSTVFTEIGVEIKPVKGAAIFWYNFHKNGTGNELTRHADCPVLVGSKWVAAKKIHGYGNEFIRKCSTNQHH